MHFALGFTNIASVYNKKNHAYTDANIACKIYKPKVRYLYIYYVFFVFRSNCVNGTVIVLYNEI